MATSEPVRACLLWAILSMVLRIIFGHSTTACCSPALAFSAAVHFARKRPAPCSTVLRHSPSSLAAVVHLSLLIPKALRSSRKHPMHSFSWHPTQPATSINFSNTMHFGSLVQAIREYFHVDASCQGSMG